MDSTKLFVNLSVVLVNSSTFLLKSFLQSPLVLERYLTNAIHFSLRQCIQLCLANGILGEVANEGNTACLWLKLENLRMTKSLTNKLHLKQLFVLSLYKEMYAPKEHINELNTILMDLKNVPVKIEIEDVVLICFVVYCHLTRSCELFHCLKAVF